MSILCNIGWATKTIIINFISNSYLNTRSCAKYPMPTPTSQPSSLNRSSSATPYPPNSLPASIHTSQHPIRKNHNFVRSSSRMDTVPMRSGVNLHMAFKSSRKIAKLTANTRPKFVGGSYSKDSVLMETAAISYTPPLLAIPFATGQWTSSSSA